MKSENFKKGLLHGIPIALGYLAVSFSFGIFAVNLGLSVLEAVLISMANLTSAGQLAGAPIIASGGSLFSLGLGQLFVNLRYALMSISLSQKLDRKVTLADRFLISFGNTDEIFAVSVSQRKAVSKGYMYGLILLPFCAWSLGTLIGAVLGFFISTYLPAFVLAALGIAIYGMFIAIVVPDMKKDRNIVLCVLFSMAISAVFYYVPAIGKIIPTELHIVICAVIVSVILAIVAPKKPDGEGEEGVDEHSK